MAVRGLFFFFLILVSPGVFSQDIVPLARDINSRPFIFKNTGAKLEISQVKLNQILAANSGDSLVITFPGLEFTVVARSKVITSQRTSINLTLTGSIPLLFTLTRTEEDGLTRYVGRILHPNAGDALVLTQSDKEFFFVRTSTQKLLAD